MKIFVLGAGTMGSGIVQTFAQSGYEVVMRDIDQKFVERGMGIITKSLDRNVKKEKMTEDQKNEILNRINPSTDINDAKDCDLIIEAAVENMEIKKKIFAEIDGICKEGKLIINKEGKAKKFIKDVEHITFSGDYAREIRQDVMYITERAVFELRNDGMYLTEIAPGINLQKDILDLMDFIPKMEENLKLMDERIFREEAMGIN